MEIKLEVLQKDGVVKVTTPYHKGFVEKARNYRGQWKENAWYFDDSIIDYVRELMIACFGTTGEEPFELVDLKITDFSTHEDKGPVELFGRTIAIAFSRDSGAKLGDGIILLDGTVKSGGSVKNWDTRVDDATFIMKDFPEPATLLAEVQEAIEAGWCQILRVKKRTAEQIQADIAKHEAILEELKNELNSNY